MLDPVSLDQLRMFVAVVEHGSFRAAAANLSRTQSALSQAIANLEQQLKVKLFDRSGHRPTMTPEGESLVADAREVLLRVDTLRARAKGLGEGLELELALTVDTLFPLSAVGCALREMRLEHPSVAIRLAVEPLGGPLAALLEKRCKLSIMVGEEFRDARIGVEAIGAIQHIAVVCADHELARAPDIDANPAVLSDHLQIVQTDPSSLSQGKTFGVLSNRICHVSSQDAKHAMILAGLGWGRLPHWQAERDLREGRLVRLATRALGRDGAVSMEAYLAHRIDEPIGPAAKAFWAALRRQMSGAAWLPN